MSIIALAIMIFSLTSLSYAEDDFSTSDSVEIEETDPDVQQITTVQDIEEEDEENNTPSTSSDMDEY